MKKQPMMVLILIAAAMVWLPGALSADITVKAFGTHSNEVRLLVDGGLAPNESGWDSDACVWWNGTETYFIIDLGEMVRIDEILMQADNNDTYQLEYSADGNTFQSLMRVEMDHGEVSWGLDTFSSEAENPAYVDALDFQPAEGRYIKIQAVEGDDSFAISEVMVSTSPLEK